jgi:benzoate-CoA ligase family protein
MYASAESLGVPETFNATTYFVDRNVEEGRGRCIAIECGELRITYDEVLQNVNRFATALRDALAVRREERVLLLLLDGPSFVYSFFGAIKAGAVPVPLNTLWKPADYAFVVRDSGASIVIASPELLPRVDQMPADVRRRLRHVVHDVDELLTRGSPAFDAEPTHRDSPAFWLYSSGSTGTAKGCMHLQHDMVVCAELFGKGVLAIQQADRTFSVAKLFFAYGLGNALYFPFSVGATTILWPGPPAPEHAYAVIEKHRPTLFYSVPTGYGMMLAHSRTADLRARDSGGGPHANPYAGDFDLSSIRLAVSAGEALPAALYQRFKQRFGIEIIDGIGSTEALHMFIANRPGAIRPGSSGRIVNGYEARILDDDGVAAAPNEVGNLWIKGDSVCAGYWNRHEKTKDTIEGHWLRTGDKYSLDEDGFFWYAGRADDMLKVGGLWVSPVEVENALIAHPAVLECGVVGHEDHDALIKPMAFVVVRSEAAATPELAKELQQFVRERLAEYKRPRWVEFLPELPKTATGKIQRFRLRELTSSLKSQQPGVSVEGCDA